MKTSKTNLLFSTIVVLVCCSFATSASASSPECLALVDRQVEDLDKSTEKLKDATKSGRPKSALQRDMMRLDSTLPGLRGHLEECKKENASFDFSKAEQRVSKVIAAYEAFKAGETKPEDPSKKTWMHVNEYKSYLRTHPSSHPMKLDHSASFIFTREEVVFAQSSKSDDGPLKSRLDDFIKLLTSEENKKNMMTTINEAKSDKKNAKEDLEALIKDLTHMQTVFAPNDPNLSALIAEAKTGLKGL